jgi:hypothetical protein
VTSLLKFAMARETTAALINCGRAPTMVTIFMSYETTTNPSGPFSYFFFTGRAFKIIRQAFTACVGPADLFGGVADNQRKVGYIFVHHCAGANKAVTPKYGAQTMVALAPMVAPLLTNVGRT